MSRARRHHRRTSRALPTLSWILVLACAVPGCSLWGGSATLEPPIARAGQITTTPSVEAPVIELLDPGGSPRDLLRYDLAATKAELIVSSESTIRQESDDAPPTEMVIPEVNHHLELEIGEPVDGTAPISLTITSASLAKGSGLAHADINDIDDRLAELTDIEGIGTITSDGRLRSFRWEGLDHFDTELRSGLENLSEQLPGLIPPLPGSAVGPGARWRATSTVTLDDTPTTVTTTYDLDGVIGSAISYSSVSRTATDDPEDSEDSAGEGARPDPDDRSENDVVIRGMETESSTEAKVDLSNLNTSTTVTSSGQMEIELSSDDGTIAIDQTIDSRLELETLP